MIRRTLFLLFLSVLTLPAQAQQKDNVKTYTNSRHNGLCSSSIMLHPDGRFVYEHGCEASSYFSSGAYTKRKDTLHFTPQDNRSIPVIREINASRVPGDSVSFTVLDKNDINITGRISAALWQPRIGVIYYFRDFYFMDEPVTVNKTVKKEDSRLTLISLNKMFARDFDYPTDTANHFVIKLHIAGDEIYRNSRWSDIPGFSLLQRGDTLYEIPDHPLAVKYILEKE